MISAILALAAEDEESIPLDIGAPRRSREVRSVKALLDVLSKGAMLWQELGIFGCSQAAAGPGLFVERRVVDPTFLNPYCEAVLREWRARRVGKWNHGSLFTRRLVAPAAVTCDVAADHS